MCPVACLDGALLGVLAGRWLRFRGASAMVVVALIVVSLLGQAPLLDTGSSEWRLWVPWAIFHTGDNADGTQTLIAGNPAAYLGYLLALGALAVLGAMWHDRTARTPRFRILVAAVAAAALALVRPRGHDRHPRQPVLRPDPVQGHGLSARLWYLRRGVAWLPLLGACASSRSHRGAPRAVAGRRLPARAVAPRLLCGRRGVRLRRGRPSGGGRDAARSGLAARQPARRDAVAAVGVGPGGGSATWRRPVLAAGVVAAGRRHRSAGRRLGGPGLPTARADARRAARAGGGVGRGGASDPVGDVQLGHASTRSATSQTRCERCGWEWRSAAPQSVLWRCGPDGVIAVLVGRLAAEPRASGRPLVSRYAPRRSGLPRQFLTGLTEAPPPHRFT